MSGVGVVELLFSRTGNFNVSIRDLGGQSLTDGCFIGALCFCSYVPVVVLIFILVAMDMCLLLLP